MMYGAAIVAPRDRLWRVADRACGGGLSGDKPPRSSAGGGHNRGIGGGIAGAVATDWWCGKG